MLLVPFAVLMPNAVSAEAEAQETVAQVGPQEEGRPVLQAVE